LQVYDDILVRDPLNSKDAKAMIVPDHSLFCAVLAPFAERPSWGALQVQALEALQLSHHDDRLAAMDHVAATLQGVSSTPPAVIPPGVSRPLSMPQERALDTFLRDLRSISMKSS